MKKIKSKNDVGIMINIEKADSIETANNVEMIDDIETAKWHWTDK